MTKIVLNYDKTICTNIEKIIYYDIKYMGEDL